MDLNYAPLHLALLKPFVRVKQHSLVLALTHQKVNGLSGASFVLDEESYLAVKARFSL